MFSAMGRGEQVMIVVELHRLRVKHVADASFASIV